MTTSTSIKLAKAYSPMIKFLGAHPTFPPHPDTLVPHPMAANGILPGSSECIPAGEFLTKLRPFQVFKYQSTTQNSKQSSAGKYVFKNRPLESNEVDSVTKLPSWLRYKPIDQNEIDTINGGGVI
ncbi:hypothetical protein TBLA_0I03500 [Henningerozyma blattae CBS 6284]|uniref:37S ribosomal protein YMR-31, mitochondrial n=1 Tax=Henningerozyma blattae (strain ATCC 34711 / CBS 6284 / DSM 70876 / NBRC 10599 / NRRL Y-10934 / UCD 77-7) TaxID=1071380 RepID=I2H9F1_HENB6|nr:hypothetical protein TBLA_0I03500 [Tetrapisispora blattae CBS 6284]CCH63003.1 hypothetical protein TBLA_0I03500 [Tetrapisispora blattae CBS 6284]